DDDPVWWVYVDGFGLFDDGTVLGFVDHAVEFPEHDSDHRANWNRLVFPLDDAARKLLFDATWCDVDDAVGRVLDDQRREPHNRTVIQPNDNAHRIACCFPPGITTGYKWVAFVHAN